MARRAPLREIARPCAVSRRGALTGLGAIAMAAAALACGDRARDDGPRPAGKLRLGLKHQPFWGDPLVFRRILAEFEQRHPDVELVVETLPNASDLAHQTFVTALEAGATSLDVFVVDTVWVAEFARAGWTADLGALSSSSFSAERLRRDFVPGAAEAALVGERAFAVPWYVDVGLLYRRTDFAPDPVRTLAELEQRARDARTDSMAGYVWQGRQYEGLVCNVYEAIWAHGGAAEVEGRLALDAPATVAALAYLRRLIDTGASPRSVLTMAEEESRRFFQSGGAAFMRNWPYAFAEAEREGSPVRGKVAIQPMPTVSGEPGHGTLGGYHLALRAGTPAFKHEAAIALLEHLVSPDVALRLALAYGRNPARLDAWDDPRLAAAPFIAPLRAIATRARPRPVTPYYGMLSDTLQSEFSAAVAGIRSPASALARAQRIADHLMGAGP